MVEIPLVPSVLPVYAETEVSGRGLPPSSQSETEILGGEKNVTLTLTSIYTAVVSIV